MYSRLNNKQQPFMNMSAYSNYTQCRYHFTETGCWWIIPCPILSHWLMVAAMTWCAMNKSRAKKDLYYQKTNLWKGFLLRRVPYDDSMSNRKSIKPYNLSADVPYPLKKPLGLQFVYFLDLIISRLSSIIYKNLYSRN